MKYKPPARSLFSIIFLIFIGNQIAQYNGISSNFSSSYLDDILCFPIVFIIVQFVHWQLFGYKSTVPISHLIYGVIFFSIIFEIILPMVSNKYVADPLDIVFYIAGASISYYFNKSNTQSVFSQQRGFDLTK